jgi:hypothetical protein
MLKSFKNAQKQVQIEIFENFEIRGGHHPPPLPPPLNPCMPQSPGADMERRGVFGYLATLVDEEDFFLPLRMSTQGSVRTLHSQCLTLIFLPPNQNPSLEAAILHHAMMARIGSSRNSRYSHMTYCYRRERAKWKKKKKKIRRRR